MQNTRSTRTRVAAILLTLPLLLAGGCTSLDPGRPAVEQTDRTVTARSPNGQTLFQYFLQPPADSPLSVASGGFFHPLTTPNGRIVTDLAPSDHLHHRGVFLALVEVHGAKDADFWGWGEPAPAQGREILNEQMRSSVTSRHRFELEARNRWSADGQLLIRETLHATFQTLEGTHVLDLVYELTPQSDLTLAQWAFGGFCLRFPKGGAFDIASPSGRSSHADPNYRVPATDWPDKPWYAAVITLEDGARFGAAVISHPDNPPTLWHNHRVTRMLNPCITAPGELRWKMDQAVLLKYRVVTFDGAPPVSTLNSLASGWVR